MRKTILVGILVLAVAVPNLFSLGIGGAFGWGVGSLPSQAMLSIKPDKSDAVFGIGISINSSSFHIGATADWWMYKDNLVDIINLYIGPGIYLVAGDNYVDLGARIPIGLQAFVIDPLELFIELAPSIGVGGIGVSINFPTWGLQSAVGFRFWF